ncbi:AAA family ATPase [Pseudovibrio denitrificans]|uniref:AAA family ATPase n=1 Tax=Pseudovibrio denitrificans TaxID=258256 RepID=UPI000AEFEE64|nr:AAA family ATPase [Pseudovibrio denitrificans]
MKISRIVIKNYRIFQVFDVHLSETLSCLIGENNAGKTAVLKGLQLCLDSSLPSMYRSLIREDINTNVDLSNPSQVLVGVEFSDFEGKVNEEALVSTWKISNNKARLFYRFRPKSSIREQLANEEIQTGTLSIEDYSWEIRGGGDPRLDLKDIEWDDEGVGEAIRFSDLQSFLVVHLPALRDAENDLRSNRQSPLVKLFDAINLGQEEQDALVGIMDAANNQIANTNAISDVAASIDKSFKSVAGPVFEMDSKLGLSGATFRAILRNIKIVLSDTELQDFEVGRNGLGMNNILYIAILIEYLRKRFLKANSSGQLILLEEPEAHLHPQLQASC